MKNEYNTLMQEYKTALELQEKANEEVAALGQKRYEALERITSVPKKRFLLVGGNRIVCNAESLREAYLVLDSFKPFKNSWEIRHTKCSHLTPVSYTHLTLPTNREV